MKYAVIATGGKQYKVSEGDIIEIDKLDLEKGKVLFDKVLLLVQENSLKLGKPYIAGEKVEGSLIENFKGDKVRVSKYKSKIRYRRVTGFRPFLSRVKIEKIGSLASKPTVKTAPKKK